MICLTFWIQERWGANCNIDYVVINFTTKLHVRRCMRKDKILIRNVLFGLVSFFNGICVLFNAKAVLVEEHQWYYLNYCYESNRVNTFLMNICPKENVIAWLEFKLAYFEAAVQHIRHYFTKNSLPIRKLAINAINIGSVKDDQLASLNDRVAEISTGTVKNAISLQISCVQCIQRETWHGSKETQKLVRQKYFAILTGYYHYSIFAGFPFLL